MIYEGTVQEVIDGIESADREMACFVAGLVIAAKTLGSEEVYVPVGDNPKRVIEHNPRPWAHSVIWVEISDEHVHLKIK